MAKAETLERLMGMGKRVSYTEAVDTSPERVNLGSVWCNVIDWTGARASIVQLSKRTDRPSLVVTPNITHVWQAEHLGLLKRAYERADLSTPDGWPVVLAVRMLRRGNSPVERISGADILPRLAGELGSIALIGGRGDSADAAAKNLRVGEGADISLVELAPPEELADGTSRSLLIQRIAAAAPDSIFIGLGVPKQEALALDLLEILPRGCIFCVGASIEFAAGSVPRAPIWVQEVRAEWLFRIIREPRRMLPRYFRAVPAFSKVIALEMKKKIRGVES